MDTNIVKMMNDVAREVTSGYMPKDIEDVIDEIKSKGFTHIKVECEAQTDRESDSSCGYCEEGYITCPECDGNYDFECYHCDGNGYVTEDGKDEPCPECDSSGYVICEHCEEGYVTCPECNGNWESYGSCDDDNFEYEIMDLLDKEDKDAITHSHVYYDGSVDTEWTFTIDIDRAWRLPEYLKAFKQTCENYGGCETENAGMHMALMTSGDFHASKLNREKSKNFITQVSKMINGLILTSSGDKVTRGFEYRMPRVSASDKYSAIYLYNNILIEYRFFDTCYDAPERILDNLKVISKTLRYYSKQKAKLDRFGLEMLEEYSNCWREYKQIFNTPEKVKRLKREADLLLGKRMANRELKLKTGMPV